MTLPLRMTPHDGFGSSDPGEPVIRRATLADAEAIGRLCALEARLQERLGGYALTDAFDWSRWIAARLAAPEHGFLIAQRNATIIAYIHGRIRSLPGDVRASHRGWLRRVLRALLRWSHDAPASPARFEGWGIIESLYVTEAERRQGLARRLVGVARDNLAARGATRIEISVMAANETAMAFWSSLGFRPFRMHLVGSIDEPGSGQKPKTP